MALYLVLKSIWIVSALGLVIVVLLHSPKGDGLGGLSGQAQLFNSTKTAELTLNRITWVLTVLFMGLTVVLSANLIPGR
jgi:preprotein translocase subunit SecG